MAQHVPFPYVTVGKKLSTLFGLEKTIFQILLVLVFTIEACFLDVS